jgi:hypothetical protein
LLAVDCTKPPALSLRVRSGSTTFTLTAARSDEVAVIGASDVSCTWKGERVAVNFQPSGEAAGQLISLELESAAR